MTKLKNTVKKSVEFFDLSLRRMIFQIRNFKSDFFQYIKNLWIFKKELFFFKPWESVCGLALFRKSLEEIVKTIKIHGLEIEYTKNKKIGAIERLIFILKVIENDSFLHLAEKRLNLKYSYGTGTFDTYYIDNRSKLEIDANEKLIEMENIIKNEYLDEMVRLIRGQKSSSNNFDVQVVNINDKKETRPIKYDVEEPFPYDDFSSEFDGTGILSWWD